MLGGGVLMVLLGVLRIVGGVCGRGVSRRGMEHGVWFEIMLGFAGGAFESPRMHDLCVMGAGCKAASVSMFLALTPLVG